MSTEHTQEHVNIHRKVPYAQFTKIIYIWKYSCFILIYILLYFFLSQGSTYAQSPLLQTENMPQFENGFIENKGQFTRLGDNDSTFILGMFSQGELSIWLTQEGLSYVFSKDIPKTDKPSVLKEHFYQTQSREQTVLSTAETKKTQNIYQHLCRTDIRFLNASISQTQLVYEDPLPYTFNYITKVGSKGIYDVKIYRKIRIRNLYQGIDYILKIDAKGELKQEFEIGEEIDHSQIRFTVENAKKVQIQKKNNLRIVQKLGEIKETKAISYGLKDMKKSYPTSYLKKKGIYSFEIKNRKAEAIVLDPILEWATYFTETTGKNSQLTDICVDEKKGGLYVCGWTEGAAFPYKEQEGASHWEFEQIKYKNANTLIVYFDSAKQIQWCTFFGVDGWRERAECMTVSSEGHLFCAGSILGDYKNSNTPLGNETSFPPLYTLEKEGAYQSVENGRAFILEFDIHNRIQWAVLLGIRVIDNNKDTNTTQIYPLNISVNTMDELYMVAGKTGMKNLLPLPKEIEEAYSIEGGDHLILKFDKHGKWLWGSGYENAGILSHLIIDRQNNLWVAGTLKKNFTTLNKEGAYNQKKSGADISQMSGLSKGYFDFVIPEEGVDNKIRYQNADKDLVLSQFTAKGVLTWSTAIGGKWEDELYDMKTAPNGHVFLTGFTRSKDFPLKEKKGAFNQYYAKGRNAFLIEFSPKGELLWSTHLPKQDSLLTSSANASVLGITPDNGVYIMGTAPIRDVSVDPRFHSINGIIEIEKELGIHNEQNTAINGINYLKNIVDSTLSPTFCLYFSSQGKLLFWDSLPLYGNEVSPYKLLDSKYAYYTEGSGTSLFQHLQIDSHGKMWGLLSRRGNQALLNPHDGSYFALNQKPYPQTSDLIFRYTNCFNTFLPEKLGNGDTLYCPKNKISLRKPDRFNEYTCLWNTGVQSDTLYIETPGKYALQIRSIYPHCPILYSDTLQVDSIPTPLLNFPTDTSYFCVGEKLYLDAFHLGAHYLWYNQFIDSAIVVEYKGDSLIYAWCRVSNPCGDTVFDTAIVRYAPPFIYLGNDTLLCHADSLYLDAAKYNANLPCLYTWYLNGDSVNNTPTYTISRTKDTLLLAVKVRLSDRPNACIAWDTLKIYYYTYPDILVDLRDTTFCIGTTLSLDAKLKGNEMPDASYRWYTKSGEIYSENSLVTISDTATFFVSAKNYCSEAFDTIHISHVPTAWTQINLPTDTLVCLPNSCTLDARVPFPETSYLWNDGDPNGLRNFTASGTYTLTLTDEMGCSQSHSLNLRMEDCPIDILFPNVFTPNGDGINDVFTPKTAEKVQDFEIQIFNTWGLPVYKYAGEPNQMQWNGQLHNKGAKVPDGAYFWILTCKDLLEKKKKLTGCVMILR